MHPSALTLAFILFAVTGCGGEVSVRGEPPGETGANGQVEGGTDKTKEDAETLVERDTQAWCAKDIQCERRHSSLVECIETHRSWKTELKCIRTEDEIRTCLDHLETVACAELLASSGDSCLPQFKAVDGCPP